MKITSLTTLSFLLCFNCFSQSDTIIKKQVKGFLFLTNYNYQKRYLQIFINRFNEV